MMMSYSDHSDVVKIKYLKLLMQEMHAKVDIGFLNSLIQVFASDESMKGKEVKQTNNKNKHKIITALTETERLE